MHKKVISLVAALVFVLGLAGMSSAAAPPLGEVWYGGYVTTTPEGLVTADTGVFVFNPNGRKVRVSMTVFNKYGNKLWQGQLLDGFEAIKTIPGHGWGWRTLGDVLIEAGIQGESSKYTFKLAFFGDVPKVPIVEVKEVIYNQAVNPQDIFQPELIRTWSETSLGGPNGTGFYPPPVQ